MFILSPNEYYKKECNVSARNKIARSIFIVKNCSNSTKEHLYGCYKASREGVEQDGKIIMFGLAWDGGQVKFVNILSIRANRNGREGYPGRCREKYTARFPYNPIIHYAFNSGIKESRGKTTDFLWDYGFGFYWYGVKRRSFQIHLHFGVLCQTGQYNSL